MTESEEQLSLDDRRLSLIDVSFENDCLYASPPSHPLGETAVSSDDTMSFGGSGAQVPESPELMSQNGKGKYNLRKSLAWDSAFFTSAGVLEPEELSCMIGGAQKGGICALPGIEEDIRGSTESISTLASDCLAPETLEGDLFEDIRASIQKSSIVAISGSGSRSSEGRKDSQFSKRVDATQYKLKAKVTADKLNVTHGLGKLRKQAPGNAQGSQGDLTSVAKPPKAVGRLSSNMIPTAKRASVGLNKVKVERDGSKISGGNLNSAKNLNGKTSKAAASSAGAPNTLPWPSRPSSVSQTANRRELTMSSSSESLSSECSNKSSKSSSHSTSRLIAQNALRLSSKGKSQSTVPPVLSHLKSVSKLSSTVSPTSSVSEWSSGSLSPTSTLNKTSIGARPSNEATSRKSHVMIDSQKSSGEGCTDVAEQSGRNNKRVSTGTIKILRKDTIKPTGLRMPSPKIGFFDGGRSSVQTPTRSPVVANWLSRSSLERFSLSDRSNKTKLGKLQPVRTLSAVRSPKLDHQQPALGGILKASPPIKKSSSSTVDVCDTSKNELGKSLGIQITSSPGTKESNQQNTDKLVAKDRGFEWKGNEGSQESKSDGKDVAITTINGVAHNGVNKVSSEVDNSLTEQKVGDIADSLGNTNSKTVICLQNPLEGLAKQAGSVNPSVELQQASPDQEKLPSSTESFAPLYLDSASEGAECSVLA